MGKVVERIRVTSVFEPDLSAEVEAVIDTGATMLVLPEGLVQQLGLKKIRDATVRYATGQSAVKSVHGVVTVEIQGRSGNFDVLAEPEGLQPLVGQIVLEELGLVVDPRSRKLTPNPESPDMPMVEIL